VTVLGRQNLLGAVTEDDADCSAQAAAVKKVEKRGLK
jgi:hypothetical protein